ncbi:hypothetical protein [Streptomyces sp. NPDC002156]
MWPEQQPPGGEQNPQDPHSPQHAQVPPHNPYQQAGYQQPNPYQQPGYQQTGYPQPNPYPQSQPGWGAPAPMGTPQPPSGGDGGGNRTKITAIVAATAVVITAGVTGFLVLGGDKDKEETASSGDKGRQSSQSAPASPSTDPADSASASASASAPASDDNPRDSQAEQPTVAGWKVVVNPKWGTAFDVPAEWEVKSPGTLIGFEDTDAKPLITMSAPAYYKSKWCVSDDDKDGRTSDTALAAVGTKGASGAKNADEVALNQVPWWVYGGYTQPDRKSLVFDEKATPYTTKSGITGSLARAHSKNTPQTGKCASDGKAITFGFKNSAGDYVAWSLYGATGVTGEVPEETIMQILSTVRLHGDPTGA